MKKSDAVASPQTDDLNGSFDNRNTPLTKKHKSTADYADSQETLIKFDQDLQGDVMKSTEILAFKEEHCQIITHIEDNKCEYFEKLADTKKRGIVNVYHVCLNQADTVFDSFESFLIKIIQADEDISRVLSNDSKLFEDTMLTRNNCICRELN